MKKEVFAILIAFLALYSCTVSEKVKDIYVVDVNEKYPKIKLDIRDVADVEYVSLYSDSDIVISSKPRVINEDYIIVFNYREKTFFIFDRKGQYISQFSRHGNGPEEYIGIGSVFYDTDAGELFVVEPFQRKVLVYNLKGNFQRELPIKKESLYRLIRDFDQNTFLCYDAMTDKQDYRPSYFFVSKENGDIVEQIQLEFDVVHTMEVRAKTEQGIMVLMGASYPIVKSRNGFYLNELSSDTIFRLKNEDKTGKPFIVRKPGINSMQTPVYLQAGVETNKYLFMSITRKDVNSSDPFVSKCIVLDKSDSRIYEAQVFNPDFPGNEMTLDMDVIDLDIYDKHGVIRLRADKLKNAYDKGELYGELKEISSSLKEDDNDIYMILKFK